MTSTHSKLRVVQWFYSAFIGWRIHKSIKIPRLCLFRVLVLLHSHTFDCRHIVSRSMFATGLFTQGLVYFCPCFRICFWFCCWAMHSGRWTAELTSRGLLQLQRLFRHREWVTFSSHLARMWVFSGRNSHSYPISFIFPIMFNKKSQRSREIPSN